MHPDLPPDEMNDENLIHKEFEEGVRGHMFLDVTLFYTLLKSFYEAVNRKVKRALIQKMFESGEWVEHYLDKETGRRVLSESNIIEHAHEKQTAIRLARMNFDVLFAPKGVFVRGSRRFDVYLLRDTIILEADLKCIFSKSPYTMAGRIREGSEQASRIVLDVVSEMDKKSIIQGLRGGVYKNGLVKEVFLFYKNKYYHLPKELIESKRIFEIIK